VLWVALQCGQRLRDLSFLGEVERLAESRYLDDHFPEYDIQTKLLIHEDIWVFSKRLRTGPIMVHRGMQRKAN
jgi:hypothetical protein